MSIRDYPHPGRSVTSYDEPSPIIGQFYALTNDVATDVVETDVWYAVAGVTQEDPLTSGFVNGSSRLTCLVPKETIYQVRCALSFTSGSNDIVKFGVYSSRLGEVIPASVVLSTVSAAGRAENIAIVAMLRMTKGDYVELQTANTTATNDITVTESNFIITEVY